MKGLNMGKNIIHIMHYHASWEFAFILILMLVTIFSSGCMEKIIYVENETRVTELQIALNSTQDALRVAQENYTMGVIELENCEFARSSCLDALLNCTSTPIQEQNCSEFINATRWKLTCGNVPATYPYQTLSSGRCYWDIRSKYGYGQFFEPMQICQTLQAGWIESCACVKVYPEIYGAQAQAIANAKITGAMKGG